MTDPTPQQVAAVAQAAIGRLDQRGLIERDDNDRALLNATGLTTLLDLVTLWNINTAGERLPDSFKLTHDIGGAYQAALAAIVFGDEAPDQVADLRRTAVQRLRAASRKHSY